MLSAAQLEEVLRAAVEAGAVALRGEVALVGFDGMTPAQSGLVEALHEAGVEVAEIASGVTAERLVLAEAADERAELSCCCSVGAADGGGAGWGAGGSDRAGAGEGTGGDRSGVS